MSPKGENEPIINDVSPNEMKKYLHSISYPASKDDLIEGARETGAPKEVINQIENLPDTDYSGPNDVLRVYAIERSES